MFSLSSHNLFYNSEITINELNSNKVSFNITFYLSEERMLMLHIRNGLNLKIRHILHRFHNSSLILDERSPNYGPRDGSDPRTNVILACKAI